MCASKWESPGSLMLTDLGRVLSLRQRFCWLDEGFVSFIKQLNSWAPFYVAFSSNGQIQRGTCGDGMENVGCSFLGCPLIKFKSLWRL